MTWGDSDLPLVQEFYESDHFARGGDFDGSLVNVRGAVESFMERYLDGDRSDVIELFVDALIESLYRTGTAKTTPDEAKRRADAMLHATGMVGRHVNHVMARHANHVMVTEASGYSQGQAIREIIDEHPVTDADGGPDPKELAKAIHMYNKRK